MESHGHIYRHCYGTTSVMSSVALHNLSKPTMHKLYQDMYVGFQFFSFAAKHSHSNSTTSLVGVAWVRGYSTTGNKFYR